MYPILYGGLISSTTIFMIDYDHTNQRIVAVGGTQSTDLALSSCPIALMYNLNGQVQWFKSFTNAYSNIFQVKFLPGSSHVLIISNFASNSNLIAILNPTSGVVLKSYSF